jgi:methyl-accepting chemotaxis protein
MASAASRAIAIGTVVAFGTAEPNDILSTFRLGTTQQPPDMTIRSKFLLSTAITVAFVIVELGLVFALMRNHTALDTAHHIQVRSLLLANELRTGSDELTRTARTYVTTADTAYREEYWRILAVRDGRAPRPDGQTIPLRRLLQNVGITPEELRKLETAEDNSNALVATEVAAFQAMEGRFMPAGAAPSRQTEAYTRTGPPDQAYAVRVMHDRKYHADKAIIMAPIAEFEAMVRARTQTSAERINGRSLTLMGWIAGLVMLLVGLGLGTHFLAQRPVLKSIELVTEELRGLAARKFDVERRLRVEGRDEIAGLAEAFNDLLNKLGGLVGAVHRQATDLVAGAGEMGELLSGLQTSMAQQRSSTQSVTAAAHEIAATSAELRRTTGHIADSAEKTSAMVGGGQAAIERVGASVSSLLAGNRRIADRLSVISSRVDQINTLADTIRRVTDKTNLLSLNAGIQAAKAGEAGHGFSVVASEIRRLADQSAGSTVEIEDVLREFRKSVDAGVLEMDRFRGQLTDAVADVSSIQAQLGEMIVQVQRLLPMLSDVQSSFDGQDLGVRQINDSMVSLSAKVEATVRSLELASTNRQQVEATGRQLQQLVARLGSGTS